MSCCCLGLLETGLKDTMSSTYLRRHQRHIGPCTFSNFHFQPSEMPTIKAFLQLRRTDTIGLSDGGRPTNLRVSARSKIIRKSYRGKNCLLPLKITSAATLTRRDPGISHDPILVACQLTLIRSQISSCVVTRRDLAALAAWFRSKVQN